MELKIRKIRVEDIEDYHKAISNIVLEKKYFLTVEPPCLDKKSDFVRTNIENDNPHYVAFNKNEFIGWAVITPNSKPTMQHVGKLGIGILLQHRGKGVGNELLEKTINHAWSRGLKRLELEVFSDNIAAIQLYKKFGFRVEGLKKYARQIDGVFQDILIMAQYST